MKPELWYEKFQAWIVNTGPKIVLGVILLVIGFWLIRLLKKWIRNILAKKNIDHSLVPFLISLITVALQVLLLLSVMQALGIEFTVFTALIGAMGVAFGLALSGTLQNFTSGVLILLLKPYRVDDIIVAQGMEGTITSIELFHTYMITFDNRTVIIPNSKLSNEIIINLSRLRKRRLDMELKFNFGFDFEKIKTIILALLRSDKRVLEGHEPEIGISTIDPDGYKVMVHAWVDAEFFEKCKFDIQRNIIDALKQQGMKLPGMQ